MDDFSAMIKSHARAIGSRLTSAEAAIMFAASEDQSKEGYASLPQLLRCIRMAPWHMSGDGLALYPHPHPHPPLHPYGALAHVR